MKQQSLNKRWAALCGPVIIAPLAFAQGAAFVYQGRLESGGSTVSGLYDFTSIVGESFNVLIMRP